MKINLAFLLVLTGFLFDSCKDDDTPPPPPPASIYNETELSLHNGDQKRWTLTKELFNGTDITSSLKDCELDNVYIFEAPDNYNIDAGGTKCPENPEADVRRGYFEFGTDQKTIKLGFADTSYVVTISKLESETFVWTVKVESGDEIERTFSAD